MKISIDTDYYNERRYGRPWIAKVDFSADPKGKFIFGDWVGQAGNAGVLILEAEPGQIVARGQKDNRQPKDSAPRWYVVREDGVLIRLDGGKAEAYKLATLSQEVRNA